MKKSLFALAAIGAVAGTAQAQSSVTVYGLIDMGYVGSTARAANNTAAVGGATTSTQTSYFSDGAESTSRLGFKGNEDLGGGLSAFFTFEQKVTPDGSAGIFNGTGGDGTRQAFVGLKKQGVGQFAFGTQYTTIFNAASQTDPGMLNNMGGNVIYDKFSGYATQAQNSSGVATATTPATFSMSGMQNNTAFIVRQANMLSFASDTFSGFQGNAYYVLGNNTNTNSAVVTASGGGYTGGTTAHTAWGLGANYTWQKLLVTANFQQATDKQAYAMNGSGQYTTAAPVMGGYGGSVNVGTNDRDNQQYYAATYDFGILKAYVQYVNRKTMDVNNPNNNIARTAQQIGVRSFVTPTVEAWASTGTGKYTVATAGSGTNAFVNGQSAIGSNSVTFGGYQLGANYWLSKRTNLYAIYGNSHQSNQIFTTGNNPTSYNLSDYALGVRHTF